MKYLLLYEDFFSIFPSNHYEDELAVNIAIMDIFRKFIDSTHSYYMKEGHHGGITIYNDIHYYTYIVKGFDKHTQTIKLEIYDGEEAKLLLSTITLNSKELKKVLLTDIKERFGIS